MSNQRPGVVRNLTIRSDEAGRTGKRKEDRAIRRRTKRNSRCPFPDSLARPPSLDYDREVSHSTVRSRQRFSVFVQPCTGPGFTSAPSCSWRRRLFSFIACIWRSAACVRCGAAGAASTLQSWRQKSSERGTSPARWSCISRRRPPGRSTRGTADASRGSRIWTAWEISVRDSCGR